METLTLEFFNIDTTITPELLTQLQTYYKTIAYESLEEWFGGDRKLILNMLSVCLFLQYRYTERIIKHDCSVAELLII